ncbi:sterol desaturase family protein [Spongiivirga sp. MCCC 1A20706]|uniref:sterol desaturase family protein n=1 Tax=Spongiivirga sp. MCCC 1A20706 TaxID=3160963 RepID=UPI003977396A
MEEIISYFETIPSSHRSIILVGGITFFFLLEYAVPLFKMRYKKFKHAWTNIFFTITTILVNFVLAFLLLKTADWVVATDFGILQWLPNMPLWAYVLLGIALLDLIGAYTAHWAEHRIKPLWMFHIIHHTDTNVDTTTANRHHPGESVIRFAFTLAGVFIVGAPIGVVMLYQSLSVVLSQFNHANIKMPKWLDTAISWVIVSPDMHKVHHHHVMPYTDTNYGNIFSIWDRLFGTFAKMNNEDIVYGVDTVPDPKENAEIGPLLKIPFQGYRKVTTSE